MEQDKIPRAISISELYNTNYKGVLFDGVWRDLIGHKKIALNHMWIVWGGSSNGKTTFVAQLCKYLSRFDKVAYNSIEEGKSPTLAYAFQRAGIVETDNIVVLNGEKHKALVKRLSRPKSYNIIVIDSIQSLQMTKEQYFELKETFPDKLFILISWADGKEPKKGTASDVRYDCDVKIRVDGFRALPNSRYGGDTPYTIWEQGAMECWGAAMLKANANDNE